MWKLLVILVAIKVDVQINISRYIKYCEKKSIDLEESDYRHDINDNLPKYEPKKIHTLSKLSGIKQGPKVGNYCKGLLTFR